MTATSDPIDGLLRDAIASSADRVRRAASDDPIAREVTRAKLFGSAEPRIGRYRVIRMLGAGGMGIVYRVHDEQLDRDVALKMLSRIGADGGARLQREARALARLSHPNVVQVFDFGHALGRFFLTMELVDGPTLREWQRGRSRAEIVRAYVEAGRGIAAAHAHGLLHLDLKPDNILVGSDGRARVADFGLVAAAPTEESDGGSARGDVQTSSLAGTPVYMSPEQVRREPLDARSDIFSFCVALFESLTGARPFAPGTFRRETRDALPHGLQRALDRGLALEPRERFAAMPELLTAIERRPRRVWLLAGAAAAASLGLLLVGPADARSTACDDVAALIDVWNDDIAQRVGASAGSTVRGGLQDHADAWNDAHDTICAGDRPTAAGVSCLVRDRERFAVIVDHLASADVFVVERAADLVADLPSPNACTEAEAAIDPPRDLRTRATELALDRRLAHLSARVDIDRATTLDAEAEALVAEALAQADPGVRARAWLLRARLLDRGMRHREAAEALESAFFLAREAGLVDETVHAATTLVGVHGVELGDPTRGLEWAEHATSAIARMNADPRRAWALRFARITVLSAANRLDEAEADVRDGLATLDTLDERERPAAEEHLQAALGEVMLSRGRMPEAQRAWARVVEITRARLGDDHPDVGIGLLNLAIALAEQGREREAQDAWREAARLWTRAYGPDSARLSPMLNNLANTVDDQDEALAMAQESLRIATKHDFSAPKLAEIHHTLGLLHKRRGDLDLAARHYGEERALLEVALGPDHPDLGHALHSLGRVEAARGDNAAARRLYDATLQLWRSAYGDDHMLVAFPLLSLGELDLAEGRPDEAVPSLRAALALWLAHPGDPRKLAQTRFALARALWHRTEDRDEARRLAGEAREWFVSAGANEAAQLAELDAWRRDHR